MITLIAALGKNNVIGRDNQLLWKLKSDLQHFKATTVNKPIIMGRKTFLSLGKALPKRLNIVLSHKNVSFEGAICVSSLDLAIEVARAENLKKQNQDIMIIGGGEIYQAFLPFADKMILTFVDCDKEGDVYFPDFNENEWKLEHEQAFPQSLNDEYPFIVRTISR